MTIKLFDMEIYIKKEYVAVIIIFLIAAAAAIGYLVMQSDKKIIIDAQQDAPDVQAEHTAAGAESQKEGNDNGDEAEEEIKVYVVGCVKNPGIVVLKKGQLIADAINAAGGAAENADMENINLVYKLKDNVMLYIKSKDEAQTDGKAGEAGKGVDIVRDSGGVVVNSGSSETKTGGKININTASVDELDTLPGIGEATAGDIIAYREKNGPFKKIEDIMNVPRIKQSRFNNIKDFITVD